MKQTVRFLLAGNLLLAAFLLSGCETESEGIQQAVRNKAALTARIATEPPGDYFVGRRYYKRDFKFWGYVRKPGQPWSTAQLVMLNEKQKLAPDREHLTFGSDNNYEYKIWGYFSGESVYEPASNRIYPEFVLKRIELISTTPWPIFRSQLSGSVEAQQTRYMIERPD